MSAEVKKARVSFSQWESYDSCPARWKYKSVLRRPSSPPGPAATRGLELHDRVDNFITGQYPDVEPRVEYLEKFMTLNPSLSWSPSTKQAKVHEAYLDILVQYRDHPNGTRFTEKRLAFDEEWYLCGAQSAGAYVIAVLDAVRAGGAWQGEFAGQDDGIVRIGEWKSGKPKPTHSEQRKLYSLFGLRAWLPQKQVETTTYYLESDPAEVPPERLVVRPTAEEKLKALWKGRFDQMANDEICAPRPGQHCFWCDYSRNKGGPCKVA